MLFVLLAISAAVAIDIPHRGVNVTTGGRHVKVEMYNKSYFKYFTLVLAYNKKREKTYQFQFTSLKPWTNKFWFEARFYHFRNNRFHAFPMNMGASIEEIFAKDYYGLGTIVKDAMGQNLPYPPNNYTVPLTDHPGAATLDIPMLGDFRMKLGLNDGDSKAFVIAAELYVIEDIKPKKCRKC